jgi:hypothetical protein
MRFNFSHSVADGVTDANNRPIGRVPTRVFFETHTNEKEGELNSKPPEPLYDAHDKEAQIPKAGSEPRGGQKK